jgi:hypothetical protein
VIAGRRCARDNAKEFGDEKVNVNAVALDSNSQFQKMR